MENVDVRVGAIQATAGAGQKINGLSRSSIYELGQQHKGLLLKVDRTTLVNMPKFNKILSACPPAKLKPLERKG